MLLGQNGFILGQRENFSVLEQYLRKLVSWDGLLSRPQGEVGARIHETLLRTLMLDVAQRGALMGMEWVGTQPPLIVWVKGGPCLKAEFTCWEESASWSC